MRSVTLVLIVHDHQPIGNFDGVFRDAYAAAYDPFLGFLESRPALRLGLHTSGPLLQWIALHQPSYLERLRRLVERGQVELVGGGFFEPILPAIPEPDRRGQIETMADWLELELGRRPRGLWLTERVWEPSLASTLRRSGVAWTAVDDAHFVAAGIERDTLWGHYLTEDQGEAVSVFPIHRELRYRVPFEHPDRTVEFLRGVADGGPGRIAVLGDDGEKFGVWPGTRALVWDERWLERWADALAAEPWIEVRTPSEALDAHPSRGLVYLPTASYHEMQEWALPPAAQNRYHRAAETLKPVFGDDALDLLRGGHWRNFQSRYPESNRLHKRALRASRRLWREPHERDASWLDARTHLWRAQCNCPYWHGVFGGLYLPHLRSAVYRDLIAAERALSDDTSHVERGDLDLDGHDDALLETPRWAAWVSARGGRLWAFDDRVALVNYIDTLARRPEAYHDRLREAGVGGGEGHSIHDSIRLKDPGLAAAASSYDRHGRDAFLDAWCEPPVPAPAELDAGDAAVWAEREFSLGATADTVTAEAPEGDMPALVKRYRTTPEGALEVEYTLTAARPRHGTLRIEINLGLHVPRADDRWVEVNGRRAEPSNFGDAARHERVTRLAFVDAWAERRLELSLDREASVERAPIDTVSLSEAGAERVFQGVGLRLAIDARVGADEPWRLTFLLSPVRAEAHA